MPLVDPVTIADLPASECAPDVAVFAEDKVAMIPISDWSLNRIAKVVDRRRELSQIRIISGPPGQGLVVARDATLYSHLMGAHSWPQ
jgi:hypothetical protein